MYTGKMRELETVYKRLCNFLPGCIHNYRNEEEINHIFCSLQFFKTCQENGWSQRCKSLPRGGTSQKTVSKSRRKEKPCEQIANRV